MSTHANMVKMTVTSVASAGVGTITLNAASSGFQSFGTAFGADATVDILITEGTAWEVARNCTYTHSGTTVTRGTLEASSTGSAVTFTSAAVVSVVATAELGNKLEAALKAVTPGGRLTLESGVPVSTTDQTAKTNIFYTPYVHNIINLWDGAEWKPITFTEYTLALGTITSGKPYDVFAYLNSGALALEVLVWTDDTTRATAVTLQDGRYCKSGDKTRLLLGSFYTTSTTTTEDSVSKRLVSNAYNQVEALSSYSAGESSHTFTTDSTMREYNGTTNTALLQIMQSNVGGCIAKARVSALISASDTSSVCQVVINLNSSTVYATGAVTVGNIGTGSYLLSSTSFLQLIAGLNKLFLCDRNTNTSNITANYGYMVTDTSQ